MSPIPHFVDTMAVPSSLPDIEISTLDLSTRLSNLLSREGFRSLKDLEGTPPECLWQLDGMGRKTFKELTVLLRLVEREGGLETVMADVVADPPLTGLPPEPLDQFALSDRALSQLKAAGFKVALDLEGFRRDELQAVAHIGKKAATEVFECMRASAEAHRSVIQEDLADAGLLAPTTAKECWSNALNQLKGWDRDAVKARFGIGAEPATLEETGDLCGVTRERVRQVVNKFVRKQAARSGVISMVSESLAPLFTNRRSALPIASLPLESHFFSELGEYDTATKLVIREHLASYSTAVLVDVEFVLNQSSDRWEKAEVLLKQLKKRAISEQLNVDEYLYEVETILLAFDFDYMTIPARSAALKDLYTMERAHEQIVAGRSITVPMIIQTVLENAETPLHFNEIARRVSEIRGKKMAPNNVRNRVVEAGAILLGKGTFGLSKHRAIGDGDSLMLANEAAEAVKADVSKQWHTKDLVSHLKMKFPRLRSKIDEYELRYILEESGVLKYLGRNIWVSLTAEEKLQSIRIEVQDLVYSALEDYGRPARTGEIKAWIKQFRGLSKSFQIKPTESVVSIAPGKWALVPRDVVFARPPDEICDDIVAILKGGKSEFTLEEIEDFVSIQSLGFGVNRFVVLSLANVDDRLRVTQDQSVRLS